MVVAGQSLKNVVPGLHVYWHLVALVPSSVQAGTNFLATLPDKPVLSLRHMVALAGSVPVQEPQAPQFNVPPQPSLIVPHWAPQVVGVQQLPLKQTAGAVQPQSWQQLPLFSTPGVHVPSGQTAHSKHPAPLRLSPEAEQQTLSFSQAVLLLSQSWQALLRFSPSAGQQVPSPIEPQSWQQLVVFSQASQVLLPQELTHTPPTKGSTALLIS